MRKREPKAHSLHKGHCKYCEIWVSKRSYLISHFKSTSLNKDWLNEKVPHTPWSFSFLLAGPAPVFSCGTVDISRVLPYSQSHSAFMSEETRALGSLSQTAWTRAGEQSHGGQGLTPALALPFIPRAVNEGWSWGSGSCYARPHCCLAGSQGWRFYKEAGMDWDHIIFGQGSGSSQAFAQMLGLLSWEEGPRGTRSLSNRSDCLSLEGSGEQCPLEGVGSELPRARVCGRTCWPAWHAAALSHGAIWKRHTTWKRLESREGTWNSTLTRIFQIWMIVASSTCFFFCVIQKNIVRMDESPPSFPACSFRKVLDIFMRAHS